MTFYELAYLIVFVSLRVFLRRILPDLSLATNTFISRTSIHQRLLSTILPTSRHPSLSPLHPFPTLICMSLNISKTHINCSTQCDVYLVRPGVDGED
jgi:hypothetical protein